MAFRSHLVRPMAFRIRSNIALAAILLLASGTALVLWLAGQPGNVFLAPVHSFLIWALLREIDPDHSWTALLGAVVAATWVLTGGSVTSAWAVAGLMMTARLLTSTTGRRPLLADLAGVTALGIAIGFTAEGWAAGFGVALGTYLDDRFSGMSHPPAIVLSALNAIGVTVVATVTGAFPETIPEVVQLLAVTAGLAALLLLGRDPAAPTSQVDARHASFIDKARLHVSRSVVGVLVFLMTILTGLDAEGLVVVIVALGLAVVSNELELLRRHSV